MNEDAKTNKIVNISNDIKEKLVSIRREIHKYPELAFEEFSTSKIIKRELDKLGIEYRQIANTGVLATIKGKNSSKCILLRSDMDALPIREENELEFKSTNNNMHACGHDAHVAWLIGAAMILNRLKDEIDGEIRLLFQPGEERGGAIRVIHENVLDGVDSVVAGHCWPSIKAGEIGIATHCAMASVGTFKITIVGKGGHGAEPHNCIDPIAIGTQVYSSIQHIVSRKVDPVDPIVVSVCSFNSGFSRNIIPDTCVLEGTIRAIGREKITEINNTIETIVSNICKAHGGDYEYVDSGGGPAVINDKNMVELAKISSSKIVSKDKVHMIDYPHMTGEDFACYSQERPGVFIYVGTYNEDKNIINKLHNNNFNVDEDILENTSSIFAQLAIDYLRGI